MNNVGDMKYLRLIRKMDKILNTRYDFHKIATKIYQEMNKDLKVENFYIGFYNDEEKSMRFEMFIENSIEKKSRTSKFSYGLVEYIINSKKLLKIGKDLHKFCKKMRVDSARVSKYAKSWLGVPIMHRNTVKGVIAIQDNKKENAYSQYDEILLSTVASRLARVIENFRLSEEIQELSLIDDLTKIANRRHFDFVVEREMKRAIGYSRPLSIAIIALDDLKKLTDKYGLLVVNKMLVHLSLSIRKDIRDTDFIARYTDDEFVLLLPEANSAGALTVSERIRSAIEKTYVSIKGLGKKRITVSIGVATYPYNAETLTELVQNADKALCQAKELGNSLVEST
jgi:diguanylate cyclase (GGDEF)-like protein